MSLFVKYGIISDEKFEERANSFCLVKNIDGQYSTIDDYITKIAVNQTDKDANHVALYTNDKEKQYAFIGPLIDKGYDVLVFDEPIDNHYIMHVERKKEKFQIRRVDSASVDKIIDKGETFETVLSEDELKIVKETIENQFSKETFGVEVQPLSPGDQFMTVTRNEFNRRMREMNQNGGGGMYAFMGNMPEKFDVVVNGNHPSITKLAAESDETKRNETARQLCDLALLAQNMLNGEALNAFIQRSVSGVV